MRTYECPSCGAAVNFASAAAVFAVCSHCRSMVVRSDVKLENIGVMAELPADLSPLQIGTRGEWGGKGFTLLGRVRLVWKEGGWTEWYSSFDDGQRGWLAETQGFFAISFIKETEETPPRIRDLVPGSALDFGGQHWQVVEGKEVTCLAGEGELPFVAKPGTTRFSVDLAGPRGEFGSLEEAEARITFYEGSYALFADLKFSNLRPVPGWTDGASQTASQQSRTLSCPNCGGWVSLRAPGLTQSAVCASCQTVLDASQPEVQIVQRLEEKREELAPVLALGLRGTFGANRFEVIGYVVRHDPFSRWSEYLLFNPWQGFLWLVNYRGHWSLISRLLSPPQMQGPKRLRFEHQAYVLFADGETTVRGVLGEFYWRVSRGEVTKVSDFVAPPKIVSRETYPGFNEETWSMGEYWTPRQVQSAFDLKDPLPAPEGPYLNAPNPYRETWLPLRKWVMAAILLLCLIQGSSFILQRKNLVFRGDFANQPSGPEQAEFTTPTFHLARPSQPLFVEAQAPVSNSWIDLDLELVNAVTGETRPLNVEVSYYFGRDSDGAWSEGSVNNSAGIPAVPQGDYFLRISSSSDPAVKSLPYHVSAYSGGVFWSNFFLSLAALLLYPFWVLWRRIAFERQRWSESDFLPFSGLLSTKNDD